jgi:Secretion system C-terminal sorting domain
MTQRILQNAWLAFYLFTPFLLSAQITYNANTQSPPVFNGTFRIGVNMGTGYPAFPTDESLSTLAYTAGARTVRPSLPEAFVTQWGYNIRTSAFQYYTATLQMRDITCMIGMEASAGVRATETYPCANGTTTQSVMFKDMYLPIWDNGLNGTPYNDLNPYATYLYKLVSVYKPYIKFWEVWNEPGFDYSDKGWRASGDPNGNWWDANPNPCDYKMQAPIFHYIRLLKISYEIIKYLDPTAYVGPSSVGYPSFLDALLRNTDNPVDGSVTANYPLKGGAYFDILCFHTYPHLDGSVWRPNNIPPTYKTYSRHSDMAADGLEWVTNNLHTVLNARGYNGVTYPKKKILITECNVPRQAMNPNRWGQNFDFGSDEAQSNYWIKAWVKAVKIGILQIHPYALIERKNVNTPAYELDELDRMGLYKLDNFGNPSVKTSGGVALTTATSQLFNKTYNAAKTAAMNLPANLDGGAFLDASGNYTYVLWAKTTIDRSETATGTYSFPASFNIISMVRREWDNAVTNTSTTVNTQNLPLTGAPIFLTVASVLPVELLSISGKVEKENHLLTWTTGTEIKADYFDVEKSENGVTFRPLSKNGKIKAFGTSKTVQTYNSLDENPSVGTNYYRLRMVDVDGIEKYSKVIALEAEAKLSIKIAPNPFETTIGIDLNTTFDNDPVLIELIDVAGRIIIKTNIEISGKSSQIRLNTEGVKAGLYILRLSNKTGVLQNKVIKK